MKSLPMVEREAILQELLSFSQPVQGLSAKLAQLDWDYEGQPVQMTLGHLKGVLRRYLDGQLAGQDVEDWANLVECREDIDFESRCAGLIAEHIYELANPLITTLLSAQRAEELLQQLDRAD